MILLLGFIFVIHCAHAPQISEPIAISAEDEFRRGKASLDQGDWERAAVCFNRALKANPNYSEAYAELAYILALRNHPEKAIDYVNCAVRKNERSAASQIMKGRIFIMIQPALWFENAQHALNRAIELDPSNQEALYYQAEAYLQHQNLPESAAALKQLVERQGAYAEAASARLDYVEAKIKASPRSEVGDKLVDLKVITRADLAALLVAELGLHHLINRRNPNAYNQTTRQKLSNAPVLHIRDIAGHWAEDYIQEIVELQVMDIFPDHSFHPQETVSRVQMAMTLQQAVISISGDLSLDTAYIGKSTSFVDLKPTHYAFNAVCLMDEKGIMQGNPLTGEFDLNSPINGIDALISIRALERIFNSNR